MRKKKYLENVEERMLGTGTGLVDTVKKFKRCIKCGKKAKIIQAIYFYDKDEMFFRGFCKKCFREVTPEYTLELKCVVCPYNFDCSIQKTIFSKKEIKEFKRCFF